jgi:hypothetical protein
MHETRCRRLIQEGMSTFSLDLSGWIVLTEVATGYYELTPLIAALAGAKRVDALAADSVYGTAGDVSDATMGLAQRWGVADRVKIIRSRDDPAIGEADIITNLGPVRPLDDAFLRRLKPTAAVALMWETWEYRPEDVDLAACYRLGIPVLGTNEHHPDLRTFEYLGPLAMKLLCTLDLEVFRSRVVVLGNGEFAQQIQSSLRAAGANVHVIDGRHVGVLRSQPSRQALQQADALVVAEHQNRRALIGSSGELSAEELSALNPGLMVAHLCGGADRTGLEAAGLRCVPDRFAPPGHMSVTTDYLGPRPLIDLHTAGLKVAERLARARAQGLTAQEAERAVLTETTLAQGFNGVSSGQR